MRKKVLIVFLGMIVSLGNASNAIDRYGDTSNCDNCHQESLVVDIVSDLPLLLSRLSETMQHFMLPVISLHQSSLEMHIALGKKQLNRVIQPAYSHSTMMHINAYRGFGSTNTNNALPESLQSVQASKIVKQGLIPKYHGDLQQRGNCSRCHDDGRENGDPL